jgi:hypothetical protein
MNMPGWSRAVVTGLMGMLFDLSLDPLAIRQIHGGVAEASIGRWSWFPAPADANLLWIPVYNFTGWIMICGFAAAFFLIGRLLYRRKGGVTEWVMLGFDTLAGLVVLAALWRGRMKKAFRVKEDCPVPMIFVSFHVANILFAVGGGHFDILWVQAVAAVTQTGILAVIWLRKPARSAAARSLLQSGGRQVTQ